MLQILELTRIKKILPKNKNTKLSCEGLSER